MSDLEPNSKLTEIQCPECGEKRVILYIHPHKYAGVFSCEADNYCGASWSCEHPSYGEETIEVDTMRNGENDTYKQNALICNDCELDCTEDKVIYGPPDDDCEGCS